MCYFSMKENPYPILANQACDDKEASLKETQIKIGDELIVQDSQGRY